MSIPLPSFSLDHLHPILVNFTAALVPVSFASDVLGGFFRKRSLNDAGVWTMIYAACITPFTGIAGVIWKKSAGAALPHSAIQVHQWLGISLAMAFIGLAIWRWAAHSREQKPGFPYLICTFLVVLALVYQGTLGGTMAFG